MDSENKGTKHDKKAEKASAGGLKSKWNEYKGEFKRIIWPTPLELRKNTSAVIVICIIFGIIIFCFDLVFNQGMGLFSRIVG